MPAAKNIFLFYGPDNYTASKKLARWREEFEKKFGDLNIHVFEGETLTAAEFSEAVFTLPFLSEKKLIIIRDFLADAPEEERKAITEKLDGVPEHCIMVFIERQAPDARTALYKKLCKAGQTVEFPLLEKPALIQWIIKRFGEKSAVIGAKEAEILADAVGPDLWQMDQETEKLALYGQSHPIDSQAIENLASANLSASIFKLTDYLSAKNGRMALKTLDTLIASGEDLFQIFHMIVRNFRILIHTKTCLEKKMDRPQIVKETGVHPYSVMNAVSQCRNFTDESLDGIYRRLLQIDVDSKSGRIRTTTGDYAELRLAIEKLIAGICRIRPPMHPA
jgi:DNA polymerase-3 subunit delta